jgi:hypothetical protein
MEFSAFFCDCAKFDKFFDKFLIKKEFYMWKGSHTPHPYAELAGGEEFYPRKKEFYGRKIQKGIRNLIRGLGNAGDLWYVYIK